MDWKTCVDRRFVKKISSDFELIESLKITSQKRFETAGRLELDDITAGSIITLYYDSLRELLEALAIKEGYKIYNHDCYCSFLKEIMGEETLSSIFDKFRRVRNDINYYGKDLDVKDALVLVSDLKSLIANVRKILS